MSKVKLTKGEISDPLLEALKAVETMGKAGLKVLPPSPPKAVLMAIQNTAGVDCIAAQEIYDAILKALD